jgi:WD40 repeat protein/tRNA A-37 threonylcarbamoyl transferase component Bud32
MPDPTPGDLFPTLDRLAPLSPAEMLARLLGKQRQHWELGERVLVETLIERLRAAGESWLDEDGVLDLIYNEIVLREERGDKPQLEEYLGRFPQHAEQLRWQFSVHEGLRECSFWKEAAGAAGAADAPGPLGAMPPAAAGNGPTTEVHPGNALPPAAPGGSWDLPTLAGRPEDELPHAKTVKPPPGKTVPPAGQDPPTLPGAHATAAAGAELLPGYEVLGELGRGGMGVVYKARQLKLRRLVALKMILAGIHAGEEDRQRFLREAEAVARLQHPNVIQIYEIGEHKGLPYLSLEFCAGGSLAARLHGTPLPGREAAQLVETLARAMHAAHQQQIVHRDLKPGNILLTADGRLKITDFGLAKKLDERGTTQTGDVMGTPSYMAPEQAGGQVADVGPATDIYALGAILYELITGRAPFRAATPLDTLRQVVSDDPVAPSRLQPKTPRDLETVCLKCLQKEPHKRYATALELADDLMRFRTGESIRARPVSMWERSVKWARQRPAIAALLALVVLTTVLGFAGVTWQLRQTEEARRRTAGALEETEEARRRLADALEKSETLLYSNHIALADREWLSNHMARVDELLDDCPPRLRGWEWRYLRRLCHGDGLDGLPGSLSVAFSPDGRRLATAEGNDVHVRELATGADVQVLHGHASRVTGVAFSADGHRVAGSGDDNAVLVWDADTGAELFRCPALPDGLGAVAFSRDGRLLAAAAGSHVVVRDAATGRPVHALAGHAGPVTGVAFSPDGKLLASSSRDQTVRLWDVADGEEAAVLRGHSGDVTGVAFSPDGKTLVSSGEDDSIRLWDVDGRREQRSLLGQGGKVTALAVSGERGDGWLLASAGGDALQPGEVKVWNPVAGRLERTFRGHNGMVLSLAFQPGGDHLASADRSAVKVWDVTVDQGSRTLGAPVGALNGVAVSPDGQFLAAVGADSAVRVWEVAGRRDPVTLRGHEGAVLGAAFLGTTGRLASAGADRTVRVWDLGSRKELATLHGHTDLVWSVASTPAGDRLASGGVDGTVRVWDLADSKAAPRVLEGHTGQVNCVAFRPDGRLLASGSADRTVRLWDPDKGREVGTPISHATDVTCLAFSPDGKLLASGGGDDDREEIKVWDVESGRELLTPGARTGKIMGLAFSPDGRRLASASQDGTIKLWETAGGQEMLTLRGHRGPVYCLAFAPDDRWIASVGKDGTVRLWDAPRPGE